MAFASFDRKTSGQPMAEINMVPLIDVVLVLLVIFIVTAPLLTNTVKLDLPKASSTADIQKPEKVEFAIDATGALFWAGERISREDAQAKFVEAGQKRPQPEVYLRADAGRRLPLRRRDPGRRLQGRPQQGRLRQRTGALIIVFRTAGFQPAPDVRMRPAGSRSPEDHDAVHTASSYPSGSAKWNRRPPGKS